MTAMKRYKVLNEHYIQDEWTGKHLNLNDACELLNKYYILFNGDRYG